MQNSQIAWEFHHFHTKEKTAQNLGLKSEPNLGVVGSGRAGRKGDGNGDEGGQDGESEHDAVGVGGVSDVDGNELMADGGGGGDLYRDVRSFVLLLPP